MVKVLLIVGGDKLGTKAISEIEKINFSGDVKILIDNSSNLRRIGRLIIKKTLKLNLVLKLFFAEFKRKKHKIKSYEFVSSRNELSDKIKLYSPKIVLLYRCGLILNKAILNLPHEFLNIHANSLPKYGGLGTIYRALKDNSINQTATLHRVVSKIDSGEIVDTLPYKLNNDLPYYKNEEIAYNTALELLIFTLKKQIN